MAPRLYGRLKGFLEGVLGKDGPGAPRVRGGDGGGRGTGEGSGVKKTPDSRPTSMRKKWAEARRPKANAGESVREEKAGLEAPGYAMPMIKHLCNACDAGKAASHIFTGVNVVLREYGRTKEDAATPSSGRKRQRADTNDERCVITEEAIPGLILALFIAVIKRMFGQEMLSEGECIEAAKGFARDGRHHVPDFARQVDYFDEMLARFNNGTNTASAPWLEMEWFDNVPEADPTETALDNDEVGDVDGDVDMRDLTPARRKLAKTPLRRKEKHGKFAAADADYDARPGRAGLLPGLGTMFQPAVDWLSEERVSEFERWRMEVDRETALIEAKG